MLPYPQDLNQGLYESIHLNFTSSLPRALLEELAGLVAKDGTGELLEQVRQIGLLVAWAIAC